MGWIAEIMLRDEARSQVGEILARGGKVELRMHADCRGLDGVQGKCRCR